MVLRFPRRRFKWRWGAVVAATTAAVLVGAAASSFPTRPRLARRPLQAAARQAGWMIMEGDSNAGHESSYDNLGDSMDFMQLMQHTLPDHPPPTRALQAASPAPQPAAANGSTGPSAPATRSPSPSPPPSPPPSPSPAPSPPPSPAAAASSSPPAASNGGRAPATEAASPPPAAANGGVSGPADLAAALSTMTGLRNSTVPWWVWHGPDYEQGGFFTTLDRSGTPQLGGSAGDKLLVPSARQLYTFSTLALKAPGDGRGRELAKRAYDFLTGSALWDGGEGLFRWQVSRDGKAVVHTQKVLYGQAFAILALARYGRTVGDNAAVERALLVFDKMDAARHDTTHGGYLEDMEAAYPPGVGIGTDPRAAKSHNTHLHLIEALTELSRVLEWSPLGVQPATSGSGGGSNSTAAGGGGTGGGSSRRGVVNARLGELVALLPSKLWQPAGGGPGGGNVGTEFYSDWKVVDPSAKLYGHELELVYFLLTAAEQLARAGVQPQAGPDFALRVGQAAMEGYDSQHGGFWTDGDAGGPIIRDWCGQKERYKTWWVQFEGMSGLFWLWQKTGDAAYWSRLLATLKLVADSFNDPQGGEFFFDVADGSRQPMCQKALKADQWKASYHALRCLLLLEEWLAAVRDGKAPVPQI